jgi:hypothetical protein
VVGVSVALEAQEDTALRQELAPLPAPRPITEPLRPSSDRPRPRWREDVGAAVLLSVLGTLRDEDVTAGA